MNHMTKAGAALTVAGQVGVTDNPLSASDYSAVSPCVKTWARDLGRVHRDPPKLGGDLSGEDQPQRVTMKDILDALARAFIPDPMRSFEEARRAAHEDLAELDGQELWREKQRALLLAALLPADDRRDWAEQRLKAALAEQQRRRVHGR